MSDSNIVCAYYNALLDDCPERVTELLEDGIDVNVFLNVDYMRIRHRNCSALHIVSIVGAHKCALMLCMAGADVGIICMTGETPLLYACMLVHDRIVEILLNHGADPHCGIYSLSDDDELVLDKRHPMFPNALHLTVVQFTSKNSNESAHNIQLLLDNGADINALYEDGRTVLHVAAGNREPLLLATLLQYCRAVNGDSKFCNIGNTWETLTAAVHADLQENVKLLIDHGSDVNYMPYRKQMLKPNIRANDSKDYCIQRSANDSRMNTNNPINIFVNPLYAAIATNNLNILLTLLDAGANPNECPSPNSPMWSAINYKYIVSLFLLIIYNGMTLIL